MSDLRESDRGRLNTTWIKVQKVGGDTDSDRTRFTNLNNENGVAFDGDTILNNDLLDNANIMMSVLGVSTNRVNNRLVVDASILSDKLDLVSNKLDVIASVLGVTFNVDGTLDAETYSTHTHGYNDETIADTDDGTGTSTDTARTTSGVS